MYVGSKGNVRIPLSELVRMKTANAESILTANAEGIVTPPATITIASHEGRLVKGAVRSDKNTVNDFQHPTNSYNAAEDMFDEDSETKFNFNKLISSGLVAGTKVTGAIQDYVVSVG
jgi:hypothetical protein